MVFQLSEILEWGGLLTKIGRNETLSVYYRTYIPEEIIAKQIVRELSPFRKFLGVAAQPNGMIINQRTSPGLNFSCDLK